MSCPLLSCPVSYPVLAGLFVGAMSCPLCVLTVSTVSLLLFGLVPSCLMCSGAFSLSCPPTRLPPILIRPARRGPPNTMGSVPSSGCLGAAHQLQYQQAFEHDGCRYRLWGLTGGILAPHPPKKKEKTENRREKKARAVGRDGSAFGDRQTCANCQTSPDNEHAGSQFQ